MKSFKPEDLIGKILVCKSNDCYIILPPAATNPVNHELCLQRLNNPDSLEPHHSSDIFPYEIKYINQRVNYGTSWAWTIKDAPAPVNQESYEIF